MEHDRSVPTAPEWATREIDRLRAELAEARRALLAGNDTVLANKKLQEDSAALKARIVELEATRLHWTGEVARLTQNSCDDQDRAERAEARVAELEGWKAGWEVEGFIDRLTRRDYSNSERLVLEAISHLRGFSRDCDALRARAERAEAERDALREVLKEIEKGYTNATQIARAALAPPPKG